MTGDNPREVLALLNSLGFVGITAPQLKAFMKDLKTYRKMKESERQQWKEDVKIKILRKKKPICNETTCETMEGKHVDLLETISSSEQSSHQENPLLRIKVQCISNDEIEENADLAYTSKHNVQSFTPKCEADFNTNALYKKKNLKVANGLASLAIGSFSKPSLRRFKTSETSRHDDASIDRLQCVPIKKTNISHSKESWKKDHQDHQALISMHPVSTSDFTNQSTVLCNEQPRSCASDPMGMVYVRKNPSRCSTRSQTKSFIRPWKLQPEAQRGASTMKSDPVALYQKYLQEWKHISFPGEEQHARLRWAIREKMLGTDPNPRPILKKSQSLKSIKKR